MEQDPVVDLDALAARAAAGDKDALDQLLAEEEPDVSPDAPWTDEEAPSDDDREWEPRSGRLVAPDEGAHGDDESDVFARDVGLDGGAASAEEAAVHVTDEPPFS